MKKKRIALFMNYPAHYTDVVFKYLMIDDRVDISLFYYNKLPTDHQEWQREIDNNERIYYSSKSIYIYKKEYYNSDIIKLFRKNRFDVAIISGLMPFTSLHLIKICQLRKIPYIFCSDTALLPIDGYVDRSFSWKKRYKRVAEKAIGLWVPGRASCEFWKKICGDIIEQRLVYGRYLLDTEGIAVHLDKEEANSTIRKQLGIGKNDFVILFVGALSENRKIESLIRAYELLARDKTNIRLIIIGDGEDANKLTMLDDYDIPAIMHIPKVPVSKLNDYYYCADCYVHPGEEPYSLALVQAVFDDIPVVTTDRVGAAYDYILDGCNGYIVKDADEAKIAHAVINILNGDLNKDALSTYNRKVFGERNAKATANNLVELIINNTREVNK